MPGVSRRLRRRIRAVPGPPGLAVSKAPRPVTSAWPHGVSPVVDGEVIRDIAAATSQGDTVLLFAHPDLCTDKWLDQLVAALPSDSQVLGMSVAGALGPEALLERGVSWIVLPRNLVAVRSILTATPADSDEWHLLANRVLEAEHELADRYPDRNGAMILFATGQDRQEELMAARLYLLLPSLPLVGGSAATSIGQESTFVISEGRKIAGRHLILLIRSVVPLEVFQHHHFEPGDERLVVTACGDTPRVVVELDGRRAGDVLAAVLGCEPAELTVARCSERPFGIRLRDSWYIRSVMDVRPDGALQFACDISEGTVLCVMRPTDLAGSLEAFLPSVPIQAGVLFHCLGRYFEADRTGKVPLLAAQLGDYAVAGGNTFGEQYMGLHLNHTLTGLWFAGGQRDE
ncbi:MAG: hypothetical protein D6761_02225 [Candidatus Dadabacteria bacterium]|nr:MAG: hypothetical protein D6761_02225 [Candidatus Dadabacteria bacterium]